MLQVAKQRLERIQSDLSRLHKENTDHHDAPDAFKKILQERIAALTTTYLNLRAAVVPQASDINVNHLLIASGHWLVQVCTNDAASLNGH